MKYDILLIVKELLFHDEKTEYASFFKRKCTICLASILGNLFVKLIFIIRGYKYLFILLIFDLIEPDQVQYNTYLNY